MKKILVMLLAFVLIFSMTVCLSSCWGKDEPDEDDVPVDPTPDEDNSDTITYDPTGSGVGIELPPIEVPSTNNTVPGDETTGE